MSRNSFKGLSRNVLVLGTVSFLTDVSSEMILPLLPIFLVSVLGASPALLGLIEGIADSTASMLKVLSGWYSDRMGKRKGFVTAGYSLSTFSKALYAFATSGVHVLLIRFADRVGKGIRTSPRDAIIADSAPHETRGRAFGLHRSMDTAGAILGPLFALALFPTLGFRGVFLLAALPASIAVLIILLFLRERASPGGERGLGITLGGLDARLKLFLGVSALFALGNFSYAFFVLRAHELGFSTSGVVSFYLLFNIVYAFAAMPAGALSDILGRKEMLVLGYLFFCTTCLGFAIASTLMPLLLLFALYGIFMAIYEPVQRAYVSDLSLAESRATALGAYHTAIGLAALPASVIAGLLWNSLGAQAAFLYGSAIALLSALLLVALIR